MVRRLRPIGHIALWAGFLVAALASVCRLDATATSRSTWQTVPWHAYLVGLSVSVVGVVVLRSTRRPGSGSPAVGESAEFVPSTVADRLAVQVRSISDQLDSSNVYQVRQLIDASVAGLLAEFANHRHLLVKWYGLRAFARVMTSFALAERAINRAWCASADGYIDEVRRSLSVANEELSALQKSLQELAERSL